MDAKKILITDDDVTVRIVIRKFLESSNDGPFEVFEAANGVECLMTVERDGPMDLILLDVEMPDMGGHETCRAIIDPIERIVDKSNDDLYIETLKQANDFRRLMTIVRREASYSSSNTSNKSKSLFYSMQRECAKLRDLALVTAGFPAPVKEEKPD